MGMEAKAKSIDSSRVRFLSDKTCGERSVLIWRREETPVSFSGQLEVSDSMAMLGIWDHNIGSCRGLLRYTSKEPGRSPMRTMKA